MYFQDNKKATNKCGLIVIIRLEKMGYESQDPYFKLFG